MLMVLAMNNSVTIRWSSQLGYCRHKFPEMPWPVVRPMRALISWIAIISG